MHASTTTLTILALAMAGCSSADVGDPAPDGNEPGTGPATEILLEPPANGFTMESIGTSIEAGQDIEYCEVARLPGTPDETFYIERFESAISGYSHHLILFSIPPGSDAEQEYEVGDIIECNGAHEFGTISAVTGTQLPYNEVDYPDGIGRKLEGGQMVIFNYHHLNTSADDVWGRHAVNFHLAEADDIQKLAKTFAMVNASIDTPPRSKASFTGECRFDHDIEVWGLVRHTHRWGKDFDVSFASDKRNNEHLWTSTDFEADTEYDFGDPILMEAGEGFRFTCDFDNTTDQPLKFGLKATDEMCILFGAWWEVNVGDEIPGQSCGMPTIDPDGISRGVRIDAPGFD